MAIPTTACHARASRPRQQRSARRRRLPRGGGAPGSRVRRAFLTGLKNGEPACTLFTAWKKSSSDPTPDFAWW
eukprot:scaffold60584_cov53-Phaeocystis_antarctica.AAC.8